MGRSERDAIGAAVRLHAAARAVLDDHAAAVEAVRVALRPLLDAEVTQTLDGMAVARLAEVTGARLRIAGVEAAGLRTVRQVLDAGAYRLRQVPGVGAVTAAHLLAAARQLADAVRESVAVHIDVDRPDAQSTALLTALHVLVEAGPQARRAVDTAGALVARLAPPAEEARPATGRLRMLLAGGQRRARALAAVAELRTATEEAARAGVPELLAQASVDLLRGPASEAAAWVDFELRSAEYYSQLAEISDRTPDTDSTEGFLPEDIAGRVREQPLDDTYRRVSLRGYQVFGARFALARRRVILGDEMGLGKTVQAIAAMAHLAARGESRFLVVCPAGVLLNWTREIEARSTLPVRLLHGPDRQGAYEDWGVRGGVAVTTFEALRGFPAPTPAPATVPATASGGGPQNRGSAPPPPPALLVVDEAHFVKNPQAKRSRAVADWAARCARVLLMTGTPMENRVEEFVALVRLLDPDLAGELGADATPSTPGSPTSSVDFRRRVAPVYLRRNQTDVLTELPGLLHTDEWEEASTQDEEAYREAVRAGNFMAMRRAAYARPEKSAKLRRLRELVEEAGENGLKCVVFSTFREVLTAVGEELAAAPPVAGQVFGPLTGSVPAAQRQLLVDAFTAAPAPAVLTAQIQAAGIGLNIQAASVVILCEPQLKPTSEHQAVARAHRMGQVRPVHVHRLLTPGGVDERLLGILARKSLLFDEFARRSELAEATPAALDVSDGELARRIVEEEQERLDAAGA